MTDQLYAAGGRLYVVKAQNSHAIPREVFAGSGKAPVIAAFQSFAGWQNYFDFDGLENAQALPQFGNGGATILGFLDSAHSGSHPSINALSEARLAALQNDLDRDTQFQADFAAARGGDAPALDRVLNRYASAFRRISFDIQMKSTAFMNASDNHVGRLIYNSGQKINGVPSELDALQRTQTWANASPQERALAATDPKTRSRLISRHNASVMSAPLTDVQEKVQQVLISLGGGTAMAHTDGTVRSTEAVKALAAYASANTIDLTQPKAAENLVRALNIQANNLNGNTARLDQLETLRLQWLAAPPAQRASIATQINQIESEIATIERTTRIGAVAGQPNVPGLAQSEFNEGMRRTLGATPRLDGVWGGVWSDVVNGKLPSVLLGITLVALNQIITNRMEETGASYSEAAAALGINITPEAMARFAFEAGVELTVTTLAPAGLARNAVELGLTAETMPSVFTLVGEAWPDDPVAQSIGEAGRWLGASPIFQGAISLRDVLPLVLSPATAYRIHNLDVRLPTSAEEVVAFGRDFLSSLQRAAELAGRGQLAETYRQELAESLQNSRSASVVELTLDELRAMFPIYQGPPPTDASFRLPAGFRVQNGRVIEIATNAPTFFTYSLTQNGSIDYSVDGTFSPSMIVSLRGGRILRLDFGGNGEQPATLVLTLSAGTNPASVVRDLYNDSDFFTDMEQENAAGLQSRGILDVRFGSPEKAEDWILASVKEYEIADIATDYNALVTLPVLDAVYNDHNTFFNAIRKVFGAVQSVIPFSQLGSIFGSNLSRLVVTDNEWKSLGVGTVSSTIGLNIGQGLDNLLDGIPETTFRNAFDNVPLELRDAGVGAISSYLFAEWVNDRGLSSFGAGLVSGTGGAAISQIANNLMNLGRSLDPNFWVRADGSVILDSAGKAIPTTAPRPDGAAVRSWNTGVGGAMLNAAGAFLGTYLASKFIKFDTIGGQVGASIGSAVGSIYVTGVFTSAASAGSAAVASGAAATSFQTLAMNLGTFAGPVGAFIGAFVGYILGGLIGSLFGGKPKSGAELGWDAADQRYDVGHVWSKNGGSKDAVRSMAGQVGELLNGVIAATGSRVVDASGVQTGAYETKGKDFIYKAGQNGFSSGDVSKVVNHGGFIALSDLSDRLIGGDVYIKRAVSATLAQSGGNRSAVGYAAGNFETNTLFGNISSAQDYASYLKNAAVINALIAAEPESAFTAGWTITFARVMELGLDRRWKSDWQGGWAAFLDETADGTIDGSAFAPANLRLELDSSTSERLFVFIDTDGSLLGVLGDTIDTASKDKITGTGGADTITVTGDTVALTAALSLNGQAASAGNRKIRVAAVIDGGAGNDVIRGGDLGNDLLGGDGNDTLIGGKLDDWMFGGAGDDRLYAGNVADPNATTSTLVTIDGGNGDYLDGGAGNDALYGGRGSDWLSGGEGVDALYGGDGGDILDAGAGNDRGANGEARLLGGAGSDQYVFYFGAGQDVIFDESDPFGSVGGTDAITARIGGVLAGTIAKNWAGGGQYLENGDVKGGEDAISFGAGISFKNLVLRRTGNDLLIELQTAVNGVDVLTGDSLTIKDWFHVGRRVEWLRFADGEEIRIGDITSFVAGTNGPDVIIGSFGADFIVGGEGNDQIRGLSGDDYGYGGAGDDLVAGDSDNDMVAGGSGADEVIGGGGNDTVFGDAGNDDLYGGAGSDILVGGLGNDTIVTGAGDDIVRFHRGDGRDVVLDEFVNNWDVVWLNGTYLNGYTLNANGTVTLAGQVVFDGTKWIGQYDWDDATKTLRRHKGTVAGQASTNAGNDRIEFDFGIDIDDLILRRVGNDVEIAVSSGEGDARVFDQIADRITIRDWYATASARNIENFVFTEIGQFNVAGFTLIGGTDGADTPTGTASTDWITGGLGDDTVNAGAGNDIVTGGQGLDVLRGQAGNDIIYGGAGDDVLEGGEGTDQLFGGAGLDIASYAASATAITASLTARAGANGEGLGDVYDSIEGLEGSGFGDRLTGDSGANILRGLAGNDTLIGGAGDDTYEIERTHGADVIRDGRFTSEQVLDAAGQVNTTDFTVTWTLLATAVAGATTTRNYRLIVTRNGTGEQVYRSRDNVDFVYVNQVQATAPIGTAWPFANGQWLGGFARTGNGVQTTRDLITSGDGGSDTLQFGVDISLSDLVITRQNSGANLSIAYNAANAVTIEGQNSAERRVEAATFADGLAVDLTQLKLLGEAATANGDLMFGDAAANTLDGLAGDDVIAGQAGNDTLRGGAGNDVLEGGAGGDTLDGGTDSQTDGVALSATTGGWGDTIRYVRSTAAVSIDLAARTAAGGDAAGDVIVAGTGGVSSVEHVVGSNAFGDTLRGDARANRLFGLGGNDILEGRAGDDVLIGGAGDDTLSGGDGADNLSGDDGNDTLTGGLGNDLIAGGEGTDTINGNEGDDALVGGAGADTLNGDAGADTLGGDGDNDLLYGGAGNDSLAGGEGADTLYGGADNDTLAGQAGNDVLRGEAGDDTYVFDATSGADTIIDADGVNRIVIADLSSSRLWLTRNGDDLKITALGVAESTFAITVSGYFAANAPTRIREIATADASLFLSYGGPLITAMTAAGTMAPAAMPAAITDMLTTYWHAGGKAAPMVTDARVTTAEDTSITGTVGAVDHDGNITGYALDAGPANGAVVVNAQTGAWTYTPSANYYGADAFKVRVTDADGHIVVQEVSVVVTSVNDAPRDIVATGAVTAIAERNRPATGTQLNAIVLATLSVSDVDAPDPGDFDDSVYTVSDTRFEVVANQLRLKAGVALDFEAAASVSVTVTATDRNGAGLSFSKAFTFAVTDMDDYLYGTAGADTLTGQAGRNIIFGYGGSDTITGGSGNDSLDGGDGADVLNGLAGDDQITGGLGNDTIDGGTGADVINGSEGDDSILGGDGADQLSGGAGADVLSGGAGNDTLLGGDHNDTLSGGADVDRLEGGAGDDILEGGAGADRFLGGLGSDTVTYAGALAGVTVNLATSTGTAGDAAGDVFEDVVERLIGSGFADSLTGSAGIDTILGGAGNDFIWGGAGNDTLQGGDGNDTLDGGAGNDTLDGGAGADILIGGDDSDVYLVTVNSGTDEIRNFDPNGTDIDVLGYQDIDRSRLWFERVGNNLVISVIGTNVVTTIKDWYLVASASDRANHKISFILAGQSYSKTLNAEGLVTLMAGYQKPTTTAAYDALHANLVFENQWRNFWDANGAPVIATIANQSINEDGSLTLTIKVTDDITPVTGITVSASAVQAGNPTVLDPSIVSSVSIGAADASGNRTLTVTTLPHRSGSTAIRIQAVDPGGVFSERVFQLTVAAVADAPKVTQAEAGAATLPLTKPTLDSGSWAVQIQAALVDQDGSETLEVRVAGVPTGLGFNKGTNLGGGVWSFTPAQLTGLALTGPATWSQDLSLTVTAIARETANGTTATSAPVALPIVINARPTDITGVLSVNENAANATSAGSLAGVDADAGETFSYALLDNAGGRFALNATTGQVTVANGALLNFEAASSHQITVRVTDSGGLNRDKTFSVAVNNVNETPTDIWPDRTFVFDEGIPGGHGFAWVGGTDPENNIVSYTLLNDAGGRFVLQPHGLLVTGPSGLDFESGGGSSNILVRATDAGGLTYDEWFTITVNNINEAPSVNATTLAVPESTEGAGPGTAIGRVYFSDPDNVAPFNTMGFALSGAGAEKFSIGAQGSDAGGRFVTINYQQGSLDYETAQRNYALTITATDGPGKTASGALNINITDVAEAPRISALTRHWFMQLTGGGDAAVRGDDGSSNYETLHWEEITFGDPDLSPSFQSAVASVSIVGVYDAPTASWDAYGVRFTDGTSVSLSNGAGQGPMRPYWFLELGFIGDNHPGLPPPHRLQLRITDQAGVSQNTMLQINYGNSAVLAPIVLDLDGDGLELKSLLSSNVKFDMNSQGRMSQTGWVGPDDALLVIDRNGNDLIDNGSEIAFNSDVHLAISDLEGLRAYDTNQNGFIDAGDAEYLKFKVWQDVNQDGVSQSHELTLLSQRDIAKIGLTLTPKIQGKIRPFDNIVHGTTQFIRGNGSVGLVGDVFLTYLDPLIEVVPDDAPRPSSGGLAPIILDLDGDGVTLSERQTSNVRFDANGDGVKETIAWVSPADGILAFDRNFNSRIDKGAEISFINDVPGAVSDLEGLAAFDSNANGAFDSGDAWFGAFVVWQDANQDGVSQRDELRSLSEHGIVSINLTRRDTASAPLEGASAILAYGDYLRADGRSGMLVDAVLAFGDEEVAQGVDDVDRQADTRIESPPADYWRNISDDPQPLDWIDDHAIDPWSDRNLREWLDERNYWGGRQKNPEKRAITARDPTEAATTPSSGTKEPTPANDLGIVNSAVRPGSALHQRLGTADARVLHMVNAMAAFDAHGASDLTRTARKRDPRVAAMLTSLPDLR